MSHIGFEKYKVRYGERERPELRSSTRWRRLRSLTLPVLLLLFTVDTSLISAQRRKSAKPAKKPANPVAKMYSMSAAQSQITLTLTQEGILRKIYPTHHVAVKSFSGRIHLPPNDESEATAELDAEAKSFVNIDNMKDFERSGFHQVLHNDVLASERHPTIKFRSVSVTNIQKSGDNRSFTLHGDLTLRGVTKRVSLPVKVTLSNNQLRATGEGTIKQTDFGITSYSGGLGTIKIGDQLKVSFVIVATGA